MQKLTLAAFAATCLLAAPAIALANSSNANDSSSSSSSNTASQHPMSQADLQKVEQKITNDLKSDGYTNVQVMPNSFLVHATNKHNNPVMMIINPDSVVAVTQLPAKQANSQNPGQNSGQNSGSTTTKQ